MTFMTSKSMEMNTKSLTHTSAPKLYRVEHKIRRDFEIAWITDQALAELVPMNRGLYSYTLLSTCEELEEIFKFRKDNSRTLITQDDIYDSLIDLHNIGKEK